MINEDKGEVIFSRNNKFSEGQRRELVLFIKTLMKNYDTNNTQTETTNKDAA